MLRGQIMIRIFQLAQHLSTRTARNYSTKTIPKAIFQNLVDTSVFFQGVLYIYGIGTKMATDTPSAD